MSLCELNCGEPAAPGRPMCAEHQEYADYWASLTPAEQRAEHEAIERYTAESEDGR